MSTTRREWLTFRQYGESRSGKTLVWLVVSDSGYAIGRGEWYCSWRKYVFTPGELTVCEQDCLRQIATFIEAKTAEHWATRKATHGTTAVSESP